MVFAAFGKTSSKQSSITDDQINAPIQSSNPERHHPCPSARSCWPGLTIASFSPFNCPTRTTLFRRLAICFILIVHTFNDVLAIASHAFAFSIIPRIIIAIIGFFCSAYLLHLIERMCDERVVFSRVFTRRDFDIFLAGMVFLEIVLVGWFFGGLSRRSAGAWWGLDLFGFLALWGVGWVAWWGPLEREGEWTQV